MANNNITEILENKNLVFVSTQPDTIFFHWQVELYLYQFSLWGIKNRCVAIFGYDEKKGPSEYIQKLATKYNILWYSDDRKKKGYSPSIRPHLLEKYLKDYPENGANLFYHDSDIFLVKLPDLTSMLNDDIAYLSDTVSYIGYNYIMECCKRYKNVYPDLPEDDILVGMCDTVGMDKELVKRNQDHAGGAQILYKNVDSDFWRECEEKCYTLYQFFLEYEKKYPIPHPIQKWTAEMWVILWVYWKRGHETRVHPELDFSWATDHVSKYHSKNIFHLAGVTDKLKEGKFFKGEYIQKNVFDEYLKNPQLFDSIDPNNTTFEYTNVIKEYVEKEYRI